MDVRGVILDFDRTVTLMFEDAELERLANALVKELDGVNLPAEVAADPYAIWNYIRGDPCDSPLDVDEKAERTCRAFLSKHERARAPLAEPFKGVRDALVELAQSGMTLGLVSSNDEQAVRAWLQ